MASDTPEELIKQLLLEKSILKHGISKKTTVVFGQLRKVLKEITEKLRMVSHEIDPSVLVDYRENSAYEAHMKIAEDSIIFLMHTNIFTFDKDHHIWKSSYLDEDHSRSYCGVIYVYNFLSDSFKYNRGKDAGYLIARIFINKDLHYFVEGKRQLGFLYNDFENSVIDEAQLKAVIESAIIYSLDFDLYTPPYDDMKQISVEEIMQTTMNASLTTGKRLGFRFQADSDQTE
jgi:hypothetical protein